MNFRKVGTVIGKIADSPITRKAVLGASRGFGALSAIQPELAPVTAPLAVGLDVLSRALETRAEAKKIK